MKIQSLSSGIQQMVLLRSVLRSQGRFTQVAASMIHGVALGIQICWSKDQTFEGNPYHFRVQQSPLGLLRRLQKKLSDNKYESDPWIQLHYLTGDSSSWT